MDAQELSRKSLEETLCTLYRASTSFEGQFKPQLEPVIHAYRVLYFKLTGAQYHLPQDHNPAPGETPIQRHIQKVWPRGVANGAYAHD